MEHVDDVPTMQFFIGISGNTQSKLYKRYHRPSVLDFQNTALWDTH